MTSARGRFPGVARDANPTDVEQLLELYGRSVSSDPAGDLARRVMEAVARAVPDAVDAPAQRLGRRTPFAATSLLRGPRRLTIRFALAAILTVALAAVALASDLRRNADLMPPPAVGAGLVPSSSPAVTFEPSATDDVLGPEGPGEEDESESSGPDDDAESDDDHDRPEEDDGDAPDDEADEDSGSASTEEEESLSGSDEPEPDASDAPDTESDADPESEPEPTDNTVNDTER